MSERKYTEKIYYSLLAYETNIFFGILSKYYFNASDLEPAEDKLIRNIFDKVRSQHIHINQIKHLVKAMKTCLTKGIELNYENLAEIKEFKSVFREKESFLTALKYSLIPTIGDLELYNDVLDNVTNDLSSLDIVLSHERLRSEYPEFYKNLDNLKEKLKGEDEGTTLLSGVDFIKQYEEEERKRESGEGFYTCGFSEIDTHLTEGFAPKRITVLAARPGVGKSALAICMMKNIAIQQCHTAQFVLEMDITTYVDRYISQMALVHMDKLVKNRALLTPAERASIDGIKQYIQTNEYLYLNDKPSSSLAEIRAMIIKLLKKIGGGPLVVFIDLFDKVSDNLLNINNLAAGFHKNLNEVQKLAKELEIHIVLVAQINRNTEGRKDKRPTLSDLKHSGAFEEVSDLIIFIDRPSYRMLEEVESFSDEYDTMVRVSDEFRYTTTDEQKQQWKDAGVFDNLGQENVSQESHGGDDKAFEKKLTEEKLVKVGSIVLPIKQYAEIIIAKQRRGPSNKIIPFIFKEEYSLFTSVHLATPFKSGI